MTETQPSPRGLLARTLLGWLAVAAALGYAVLVHYGVGPSNKGRAWHWYTPRTFLLDIETLYPVYESIGRALLGTVLPAVVLAVLVIWLCRSSVGRALALASIVAVLLFTFYGVRAPFVWEFFHWRASAVLSLMAIVIGFAFAAPWLAASWLRLSWPLRLLIYLPIVFAIFAFVRNATGTDESLQFAISPWPAVPVFAIEVGALFIAALMTGIGIGLAALAPSGGVARPPGRRALLLVLGLALPALLLWIGSQLGLFPFRAGTRTFVGASIITALVIALIASVGKLRRHGGERLALRARHLLVGAALVGIPLVSSEALARWDYYRTREMNARRIIEALDTYIARETVYPDTLQELVKTGDIEAIPEPSIGFGFLYDANFRYQNFGTSFILEFPAPRWVECAYTPPFSEEDDEVGGDPSDDEAGAADESGADAGEEQASENADAPPSEYEIPPNPADADAPEDEGEAGGDGLDEAWSCPSKPPELW